MWTIQIIECLTFKNEEAPKFCLKKYKEWCQLAIIICIKIYLKYKALIYNITAWKFALLINILKTTMVVIKKLKLSN